MASWRGYDSGARCQMSSSIVRCRTLTCFLHVREKPKFRMAPRDRTRLDLLCQHFCIVFHTIIYSLIFVISANCVPGTLGCSSLMELWTASVPCIGFQPTHDSDRLIPFQIRSLAMIEPGLLPKAASSPKEQCLAETRQSLEPQAKRQL